MISALKKLLNKSSNIHSLAGNMVFAVFSLILFLFMVRTLDKELYGRWIIFITAASLLDMLRLGLTGTGAIRLISTSQGREQHRVIASSYHFGLITVGGILLLFIPLYFILKPHIADNYYLPVLLYYPLLALFNTPSLQANTYAQGIVNFKRVMVLRGLKGFLNLVLIGGYILLGDPLLEGIIIVYIAGDALVSLLAFSLRWDGRQYFSYYHRKSLGEILKFGKYSTASFVGSNLLRSSDTFILSFSMAMGAASVAVYAIPLKFVEVVELPLRSFTATSFPKLSAAIKESKESFNNVLGRYLSFTAFLLIPILLFMILFSNSLLQFIGGDEYSDSLQLQKQVLFVIIFYIILLPFDRFSGMALFALDKPRQNFIKIMIMLITNIICDIIAVFIFESLVLIAVATTVFTVLGILYGWHFIKKDTGFSLSSIPSVLAVNNKLAISLVKGFIK